MSDQDFKEDPLKKMNSPIRWPDIRIPGVGDQYQFTDARSVVANPTLRNPPEPVIIDDKNP